MFTQDEVYYLNDTIIFQVENDQFEIPRHILELHSPIFANIFSLPSRGNEMERHHDSNLISLEHVTTTDFHRLMELVRSLTSPLHTTEPSQTQPWGPEEWMSILRLTTKWQIEELRNYSIHKLDALKCFTTPLMQIQCGRDYNHPPWVRDGYMKLIMRDKSLSEKEGTQLGLKEALMCAAARETALRRRLNECRYGGSEIITADDYNKILEYHFGDDIPKRYGVKVTMK
ncbi:hypothetical protein K439DRAFT_1383560 [Ramaria rubella]|nr:hypothetical protein K439DRAFT_1383560 [Ramaria rubella]